MGRKIRVTTDLDEADDEKVKGLAAEGRRTKAEMLRILIELGLEVCGKTTRIDGIASGGCHICNKPLDAILVVGFLDRTRPAMHVCQTCYNEKLSQGVWRRERDAF